jgi:metabolite-proton symporter
MTARNALRKVMLASLVGTTIEWFDFFLYGSATALVFNRLFFPAKDPLVSLLLTYVSFALPFFIRPLGGIVFAHIGDRVGRKRTLVLTLSLMGVGTTLIGCLPTYEQVGFVAPALLVALRLVQGLGLGGEWGGAILLAYEYADPRRKGLFASIPQSGSPIGLLFSTLFFALASLLPDREFISWGWRIPFVLSAGLVLLGLWIRQGIDETPEFKALQSSGQVERYPLRKVLRTSRKAVVIATLVKFVETGPFYIFAVFLVGYATNNLGYSRVSTLAAIAAAALVASLMIPVCGAISDRAGRYRVFAAGSALLIVFAVPYFWLLSQRSIFTLVLASVVALGLIWPLVTSVLSTMLAELFDTSVRYSGISLGYQLGSALAGGTAPLLATLLLSADQGRWRYIALYIACIASISWAAATRGVSVSSQVGSGVTVAARN